MKILNIYKGVYILFYGQISAEAPPTGRYIIYSYYRLYRNICECIILTEI